MATRAKLMYAHNNGNWKKFISLSELNSIQNTSWVTTRTCVTVRKKFSKSATCHNARAHARTHADNGSWKNFRSALWTKLYSKRLLNDVLNMRYAQKNFFKVRNLAKRAHAHTHNGSWKNFHFALWTKLYSNWLLYAKINYHCMLVAKIFFSNSTKFYSLLAPWAKLHTVQFVLLIYIQVVIPVSSLFSFQTKHTQLHYTIKCFVWKKKREKTRTTTYMYMRRTNCTACSLRLDSNTHSHLCCVWLVVCLKFVNQFHIKRLFVKHTKTTING